MEFVVSMMAMTAAYLSSAPPTHHEGLDYS